MVDLTKDPNEAESAAVMVAISQAIRMVAGRALSPPEVQRITRRELLRAGFYTPAAAADIMGMTVPRSRKRLAKAGVRALSVVNDTLEMFPAAPVQSLCCSN